MDYQGLFSFTRQTPLFYRGPVTLSEQAGLSFEVLVELVLKSSFWNVTMLHALWGSHVYTALVSSAEDNSLACIDTLYPTERCKT